MIHRPCGTASGRPLVRVNFYTKSNPNACQASLSCATVCHAMNISSRALRTAWMGSSHRVSGLPLRRVPSRQRSGSLALQRSLRMTSRFVVSLQWSTPAIRRRSSLACVSFVVVSFCDFARPSCRSVFLCEFSLCLAQLCASFVLPLQIFMAGHLRARALLVPHVIQTMSRQIRHRKR